jgi:hypothetical protein
MKQKYALKKEVVPRDSIIIVRSKGKIKNLRIGGFNEKIL